MNSFNLRDIYAENFSLRIEQSGSNRELPLKQPLLFQASSSGLFLESLKKITLLKASTQLFWYGIHRYEYSEDYLRRRNIYFFILVF